MRQLALLFLLTAAAFCQTSQVPYGLDTDGPGPTFTNDNTSLSYARSYSSIRKVDFRNIKIPFFDKASFSLKNGHYKHDEPGEHWSIDLDSVYYLSTSSSSKGSSALVLYSWSAAGGSSSQGGSLRFSPFRTASFDPYKRSTGTPTSKQVNPRIHSTLVRTRL